jgi:hypothetical protein
MPRDVNSPINSSYIGSRLANQLPLSPGARSNPSRGDRGRRDNAEEPSQQQQPPQQVSRQSQEPGESAPVGPRTLTTGPED